MRMLWAGPVALAADRAIQFLEERVKQDPDDFIAHNQLVARYLERFRSTGNDGDLAMARREAEASLKAMPGDQNPGGIAAEARVQLALHQFAAARDDARRLLEITPGKTLPFALLGDALLELGDVAEAAAAYTEMRRRDESSVDTQARLARLSLARGEAAAAREGFSHALALARELTPPAPHVVAWCLVQLGQFCFSRGDWTGAEENYQAALKAVPDDWSALDHVAELRAAEQRTADAIAIYEKLVTRLPRPELQQALGDLYAFVGRSAEAKTWHARAESAYLAATRGGDVRYFHHLAGFYSDSEENPPEALRWARKDMELRHGASTWDALAWALYRNREFAAAAEAIDKALAGGIRDAHVLFHAGMIHSVGGNASRGADFLREALSINPRYASFHVHR
jgi:tetratricopeptide (TPR) repeat protein